MKESAALFVVGAVFAVGFVVSFLGGFLVSNLPQPPWKMDAKDAPTINLDGPAVSPSGGPRALQVDEHGYVICSKESPK